MRLTPPKPSAQGDHLAMLFVWMELVRLPRLLVAPGGVIAGYALAAGGLGDAAPRELALPVTAVLMLYAGALLLNAYTDRFRDLQRHPRRALPSGRISPRIVAVAAIMLLVAGIVCAGLTGSGRISAIAVGLALLAVLFSLLGDILPWVRAGLRALGHGLIVLLGGAVAGGGGSQRQFLVLIAIALVIFFVFIIAGARQGFPRQPPRRWVSWLLFTTPLLLLVSGVEGIFGEGWTCAGVWAIWALFTYTIIVLGRHLLRLRKTDEVPWYEDALLRNLIFMQSFWIAASGASCWWGAGVLLLWPISGWLHRWSEWR